MAMDRWLRCVVSVCVWGWAGGGWSQGWWARVLLLIIPVSALLAGTPTSGGNLYPIAGQQGKPVWFYGFN